MNSLLEFTLEAHGGLARWQELHKVSAHLLNGGVLWPLKGKANILDDVRVTAHLHEQWASHAPFRKPNQHTLLLPDRVAIATTEGTLVEEVLEPRATFEGHTLETPWSDLQLAYFAGYAMWNYLTTPFNFTLPGYQVEELAPWQAHNQTLRRLQVTFPDHIATHSKVQTFYINADGLIVRHDYDVAVAGGVPAVHYPSGHTEFAGIVVPTQRIVYVRQPDLSPAPEPVVVSIALDDIQFS